MNGISGTGRRAARGPSLLVKSTSLYPCPGPTISKVRGGTNERYSARLPEACGSLGGGAACRVCPKCTVTSPGSVVERPPRGGSRASRALGKSGGPSVRARDHLELAAGFGVAASSWIPTLSMGHFTGMAAHAAIAVPRQVGQAAFGSRAP